MAFKAAAAVLKTPICLPMSPCWCWQAGRAWACRGAGRARPRCRGWWAAPPTTPWWRPWVRPSTSTAGSPTSGTDRYTSTVQYSTVQYLYCGVTNLGDRQVRTSSRVPPVLLHENIENSESHFRRPKVVIFTFCILRNLLHEQLKLPVMFDFYSQFLFYFYFYIKQMKEIQMYIVSNYWFYSALLTNHHNLVDISRSR